MKQYLNILGVFVSLLLIVACGDSERDLYNDKSYSEILNSLIMEDTDLSTISKSTNVSSQDLIKIKYGLINTNEDLTNYLRDLKYAYDNGDDSKVEDLQEPREFDLNHQIIGEIMPISKYKEQELETNEYFQSLLPIIGQNFYDKKARAFIEDKYSFIGVFKNVWDYIVNSKEEYTALYKEEFQKVLQEDDINKYLENRINAYTQFLYFEHEILYGIKSNVGKDSVHLQLKDMKVNFDDKIKQNIIEHASLDLYDFAVNVAEETVIALIIWAIIAFITEIAIEAMIRDEISKMQLSWKKDRGFFKNLAINALSVFGTYSDIEERKAEIRSKYRTIQFWISLAVTCILFAWSYFYVMIPSAKIEMDIEQKIHEQTEAHFGDINLWVINELNKITKSL
jgi:hypothetical protein